jgi:hypothetical protein
VQLGLDPVALRQRNISDARWRGVLDAVTSAGLHVGGRACPAQRRLIALATGAADAAWAWAPT